ncbi:hypothetical protein SLA2020_500720 [Shorea laevis]
MEKLGFQKEDWTAKITLRPYQVSDLDDFLEWANDNEVIRTSRLRHFTSREDALTYLKEVAIPDPWYKAVCLEGRPVGFVLFSQIGPGSARCRGTLSVALGRKYWGKGIITTALNMLVSAVLEEFPDVERVEAFTLVDNKAMQRVLAKLGFQKEGKLRKYLVIHGKVSDVFMYSLLRSEYLPRPASSTVSNVPLLELEGDS